MVRARKYPQTPDQTVLGENDNKKEVMNFNYVCEHSSQGEFRAANAE